MSLNFLKRYFLLVALVLYGLAGMAQTVPLGLTYQAVARDNYGKELANYEIDVRFSIISGTPMGTVVYQELHSSVITSKYGVFSLVIGKGIHTAGVADDLSQIGWEDASHYLKVEIKFNNDYMDMGTMQFLAVPYALYARKSLEPGPQGPKGEQGDPASDDQVLSFDGTNLSISGGNTLNLSTLNVPHQLTVAGNNLSILGGNEVVLPNEIQDLSLDAANKLTITKNPASTGVDLSKYDQTLTYTESTNSISISGGNSVSMGSLVAFRARKIISETGLSSLTNYDFITPVIDYNDGLGYDGATGVFTAPVSGIYSFVIGFSAVGSGGYRELKIYLNGSIYEVLNSEINSGISLTRSLTMKLTAGDRVKTVINTGVATESGTGSFSGYKVY